LEGDGLLFVKALQLYLLQDIYRTGVACMYVCCIQMSINFKSIKVDDTNKYLPNAMAVMVDGTWRYGTITKGILYYNSGTEYPTQLVKVSPHTYTDVFYTDLVINEVANCYITSNIHGNEIVVVYAKDGTMFVYYYTHYSGRWKKIKDTSKYRVGMYMPLMECDYDKVRSRLDMSTGKINYSCVLCNNKVVKVFYTETRNTPMCLMRLKISELPIKM